MMVSFLGYFLVEKENFIFILIVKFFVWSRERNCIFYILGVVMVFLEILLLKYFVFSDVNYMFILIDESEFLLLKICYIEEFFS